MQYLQHLPLGIYKAKLLFSFSSLEYLKAGIMLSSIPSQFLQLSQKSLLRGQHTVHITNSTFGNLLSLFSPVLCLFISLHMCKDLQMKRCTHCLAENIKLHWPAEGNNKSVILKSSYNVFLCQKDTSTK